jgi:hypothetical protein
MWHTPFEKMKEGSPMVEKLNLYWRWLRIKRVKARRYIQLELPSFSRVSEYASGDNFPVLASTLVRME